MTNSLSIMPRSTPEGALEANTPKMPLFLTPKTGQKTSASQNACIDRPAVLYYRGSRLQGQGRPLGIET